MSHPPNLKNCAVSKGKNGSKMYFKRAILRTKDREAPSMTFVLFWFVFVVMATDENQGEVRE